MGHHRDPGSNEPLYRPRDPDAPLELHRLRPPFLDAAAGVLERLLGRLLIGQERHVGDDEGAGGATDDGPGVVDHVV